MKDDLWSMPIGAFKSRRKDPQPRGHAAPPGSGPEGETCRSCRHLVRRELAKTYFKCALRRRTHGRATDVRAKDPACARWEKTEGGQP